MQITILRHPPVVADGICYGQSDVPLAPGEPEKTVETLKKIIPSAIDQIYTSPLARCRNLAEQLASCHQHITPIPDLMEVDFGEWELTPWDGIPQDKLEPWMQDFVHQAPPGGESLEILFDRVTRFIATLRNDKTHKCLIITHAGPIRCIIASILRIPLDQVFKISIEYGAILNLQLGTSSETDQIKFT